MAELRGEPSLADEERAIGAPPIDAQTILENVVRLDEMLDDESRRALGAVPYLEMSKHMRIRRAA